MYVLFITVLTVFTLCVADSGVYKISKGCDNLLSCASVLNGSEVGSLSGPWDIVKFHKVCQSSQDLAICIAAIIADCLDPDTLSKVITLSDVLSYMCSNEGKEAVLALQKSPCTKNENTQIKVEKGMQKCNFEYESKLFNLPVDNGIVDDSEVCRYIDEMSFCIAKELNDLCGNRFGTFFRPLWKITYRQKSEHKQCDSDLRYNL